MNSGNRTIEINGNRVTEGTSLYDTEYDRVLWVSGIDGSSVTLEPVTDYDVDDSIGWPPSRQTDVIADGTVLTIHELKSLINGGRFEIGP